MDNMEIVNKKVRNHDKKLHKSYRNKNCKIQEKAIMQFCPKYELFFGDYELNDIVLLVVLTKKKKLPVFSCCGV